MIKKLKNKKFAKNNQIITDNKESNNENLLDLAYNNKAISQKIQNKEKNINRRQSCISMATTPKLKFIISKENTIKENNSIQFNNDITKNLSFNVSKIIDNDSNINKSLD